MATRKRGVGESEQRVCHLNSQKIQISVNGFGFLLKCLFQNQIDGLISLPFCIPTHSGVGLSEWQNDRKWTMGERGQVTR